MQLHTSNCVELMVMVLTLMVEHVSQTQGTYATAGLLGDE
jgi:hypothetical protein